MSQTLQNQIIMAKSMNGIVTLSDGAGTTIENGSISTGGIDATSIYSDEYNTRGKSKMESTITIATSTTPYTIAYGTAQNIVFTGSVVQTLILPVVLTENLGATFTIIRTSAVQMIIQAPSGYTFYDENNSFSSGTTLFSNTRVVTFTAINTTASPAMWSMTYSQSPNQNLAVTISNTQNITGTKSFNLVNFNSLPSFIGTLGAVASNNFITRGIADSRYSRDSFGTITATTTLTATSPNNLYVSRPSADYTITLPDVTTLSLGYSYTFILNLPDFATITNMVEILTYDVLNQLINTTSGGEGNYPMDGKLISLTIECISTASTGIVWNIVQTNANNLNLVYADLDVPQTITGDKYFTGSTTFTGGTEFLHQAGGVYPYFNPNMMAPPTPTTQSFLTKQWGDTYYARLANPNVFTNDNTFSQTTTFTGNINADGNTISPTELGYLDGVTANIQAQLNSAVFLAGSQTITGAKTISGTTTFTGSIVANSLTITPTQLGYLSGAGSNIQTQLNNRVTLNTSQTITSSKIMNADLTMSGTANLTMFGTGYLLPLFPLSSTSMRIGLNSMLRQQATATYNIAIGENALLGYATTPAWNQTKRNIAIGYNAGKNLYYDSGTEPSDDNVIIGYNAGSNMFFSSKQNVLIGNNCGSSNNYIQKCVFIGHNIASTGPYFLSDSVIIGANSLQSISDKSGVVCIGSGNLPVFSGNSPVCIGVNCGLNAGNNNRGLWIGGDCGNNVDSNLGSYFIGNGCGNSLISGGSCCFMGNSSDTTNNALTNTFVFGYTANCSTNDTFYVGGVNFSTGKTMDLLIANKNRILSQNNFIGSGIVNLTFQMGEHINLDTITSVVNLPLVGSNNVGARFTFYRDFTTNLCTLTAFNSFGLINDTGASATTYVIESGKCYATLVATAVERTSGPAEVCWFVINEDVNNEVSMIDSEVTTLNYNTTAITYDDTSSPAYTSISSQLRLNNGANNFQASSTLTGVVGSLSTPLNSVYILSGATGSLTLPSITTNLIGVRITFVKQNNTGTWTLSCSSTDTFRFQGSTTTATSLPMSRTWTMCELIAESGVWNIINQNAGVDGYYYKDEIAPTNITANVTTWTNPIYETYLVNNTGNITISLPLSSQVFIGLVLRFRKIGTLATTITLNIQTGSGQAIKFAGGTANLTTGTLLSTTQTFASVMYISSNLWAVLG